MRPAVVTAVLLLMCILVTVATNGGITSRPRTCGTLPDVPCDDGWSRIDVNRCAKYISSPKTFPEAQEHCRTLNGDLLSLHSSGDMLNLLCLHRHVESHENFWIGAKKSEGGFIYTDGSEFNFPIWDQTRAGGQEDCVELNLHPVIAELLHPSSTPGSSRLAAVRAGLPGIIHNHPWPLLSESPSPHHRGSSSSSWRRSPHPEPHLAAQSSSSPLITTTSV